MVLPPSVEDIPPPGLALVEELDKLLLVQVRQRAVPFGCGRRRCRLCQPPPSAA